MARGHPVDEQGRVLPECDWPADKAAPDGLELIRRFCNTCNLENGADRFASIAGLERWLADQELADVGSHADESDRRLLIEIREHLRSHALAHHDGRDVELDERIVDVPIALALDEGRLNARPTGRDVASRTIGFVALAVLEAQRAGVWRRFKACPSCGWVFFDRSKNQSGRWCSMNACGGRAKVAAYRDRQKEATR